MSGGEKELETLGAQSVGKWYGKREGNKKRGQNGDIRAGTMNSVDQVNWVSRDKLGGKTTGDPPT